MLKLGRFYAASACLAAALVWVPPDAASAQPQSSSGETTVSGLSITSKRAVPIPQVGKGAPAFSSEQMEVFVCKARTRTHTNIRSGGGRASFRRLEAWTTWASAERARSATVASELIRREAAEGRRSPAEVEASELARQKAVQAYHNQFLNELIQRQPGLLLARDLKDPGALFAELQATLDTGRLDSRMDTLDELALAQERSPITGFALEGLTARYVSEGGREVMVVNGALRNLRDRSAAMPSLQLTLIDRAGFVLDTENADSSSGRLAPGEAREFVHRMTEPPAYAHNVRVEPVAGPQRRGGAHPDLRCDRRG